MDWENPLIALGLFALFLALIFLFLAGV